MESHPNRAGLQAAHRNWAHWCDHVHRGTISQQEGCGVEGEDTRAARSNTTAEGTSLRRERLHPAIRNRIQPSEANLGTFVRPCGPSLLHCNNRMKAEGRLFPLPAGEAERQEAREIHQKWMKRAMTGRASKPEFSARPCVDLTTE